MGDFCFVPDRLVYKNINSLTRALGHVVAVKDRSLEIKFSNGYSVLRHCNDVISCNVNTNSEMSLDILDLPFWPHSEEEHLTPNESQFDIFLPEINIDNSGVAQPTPEVDVDVPDITGDEILVDPDYQLSNKMGQPAADKDQPEQQRHSARVKCPTYKFLAQFADT